MYHFIIISIIILFCLIIYYFNNHNSNHVAIVSMMRKPTDLDLWLKYHRDLGIKRFFIRLEDTPGIADYLRSQPDITLETGSSDSGNNYNTLQTRQIEFVNKCIPIAKNMGIQWLFHIDSDELLNGSIKNLHDIDKNIKCLRIENAEAVFDDNEQHCFSAKTFLKCSIGAPCRSYVNGKGAGRIVDHISLAGPHHFAYKNQFEGPHVLNLPIDTLHVLHFDSCSLGSWVEKFKHLSNSENIPFPYYNKSISVAHDAQNTYITQVGKSTLDNVSKDFIYTR